jgi:hypothetical protein
MEEVGSTETTVKFYQTTWHLTTSWHLQMSNKAHTCVCVYGVKIWISCIFQVMWKHCHSVKNPTHFKNR